jgi:hypothetical protein
MVVLTLHRAPGMRSALGLGVLLVFGCSDEGGITRLRVTGAFDPPMVDFGEVPIGLSRAVTVTLVNTGEAPFTISDVDSSGAFSIRAPNGLLEGLVVSGGQRVELEVSFISISETAWAEPLVVHTADIDIPLQLSARGVIRMVPEFTVEPPVLDFGSVELGSTSRLTFAVKNVGNSRGTLVSGALASGSTDFALSVPWPLIVQPEVIGVFPISFTPTRAGPFTERMLVGVSELPAPIEVELRGIGGGADGQFFCSPSAVTFGVVERGRSASQTINCTARGGEVQITGSELVLDAQFYAISQQPPPSLVAADQSVSYTVDFRPDGLPMPHEANLWIHYTGATGPATLAIPVTGEVGVPPPTANAISAILTWDKDFTDVDLHLVRPGGSAFTLDSDCFWASKAPDWGTVGSQADNPFLDLDDIDGFGPETINLREAGPGTYGVFAHYYADRRLGATSATVEIHLGGVLVGTFYQPNIACNDLWTVGTIEWNGVSGTFTPGNTVVATQTGNCE